MKTRAPLAATVKTRPRLEPAACGLPLRPRVTAPRAAPEEKNLRRSLRSPSMSDFWSESLQSAKQMIAQDERLAWIDAVL